MNVWEGVRKKEKGGKEKKGENWWRRKGCKKGVRKGENNWERWEVIEGRTKKEGVRERKEENLYYGFFV